MRPAGAGAERFARFAWGVLAYSVAVVLWGAFVRATGSGAGCGSHWPLCNGEVVPRAPRLETVIELTHRLTSGLALVAVAVLLVWAFRRFERGHPVRRGAVLSVAFMLSEAAVGAGLVLFELVAEDDSIARAVVLAVHLVNTFLLLAALALTAHWASAGARPPGSGSALRWGGRGWGAAAALGGMLLVGVSGAVSALGDTLYPAATLGEALRQDVSATAHLLVRLRVLHPLIAVVVAVFLLFWARGRPAGAVGAGAVGGGVADREPGLVNLVSLLVFAQLGLGTLNVVLLAPVWLQLVHLLFADLLWIVLVLLAAERLAPVPQAVAAEPAPARSGSPPPGGRLTAAR